MSKRLFALLSVAVLASMVLAACGTAATPTAAPTQAATQPPAATTAATQPPAATTAPAAYTCTDPIGCATFKPGDTIKIGMGAPMTGDNAAYGIDASNGAKLCLANAGDFKGWKYELDAQDDGGNADGGAAVANKFVADPAIVAVEGHLFSGASAAAIPIYEKAGIPMMSPSATNPTLTQSGSKVFNRDVFTDAVQGKFAAEYLFNTLKIKDLAILHDGQTYGQGLAQVVNDHFKELGGNVVTFQAITPGLSDYSAVLADVASKNPQALFYGGYVSEAVPLVTEKAAAGLGKAIFFSDDGVYGKDFITRGGASAEGGYATSLVPPSSAAVDKFNSDYQAAYGQAPGTLSPYSWTSCDAAVILKQAIESVAVVGSDGNLYIPRSALVAAVRATKDFQGLSGKITCDSTGECGSSGPVFYMVKDGKWVPAQ